MTASTLADATDGGGTALTVSPGLNDWLRREAVSLAFSTYQTGQLFLVGAHPNGTVSFNQQYFVRAMGLCRRPGRLYLASHVALWRLENILQPGEVGDGAFDEVLVPRNAQFTGDLDVHELDVDVEGRVVFVNTRWSCLAAPDPVHSFLPIWRPPFVTALADQDRCHLNGLAMQDGRPAFVTLAARSDAEQGWRAHRSDGGLVMDVRSDRVVADGLSMPHSPRVRPDGLYVLEAGRGYIQRVEPDGRRELAFCPGFLRGLAFHGEFALVTVSKPRNGAFQGLELEAELARRAQPPWCGVLVVRLDTGDIAEWIRLEGDITELFDIAVLPGARCPMSLGPHSAELAHTVSIRNDVAHC